MKPVPRFNAVDNRDLQQALINAVRFCPTAADFIDVVYGIARAHQYAFRHYGYTLPEAAQIVAERLDPMLPVAVWDGETLPEGDW